MDTNVSPSAPTPPPNQSSMGPSAYARREYIGAGQQQALVYSGLLFMFVSLCCFGGLLWWLFRIGGLSPYTSERGPSEIMWYIGGYMPALIMFFSAIISALVGYSLLSAAGAATKEVIPRSDYELLSALVAEEKEKGIDLYVRLNSLSGATGFFTKIGITGLPLATIALSLIFTVLGLTQASGTKLFDLANLTLGAFLGSYVQRQVSTSQPKGKSNAGAPEA